MGPIKTAHEAKKSNEPIDHLWPDIVVSILLPESLGGYGEGVTMSDAEIVKL